MNILPHKAWHVWKQDNIDRVERDEARHAAKQEQERKRVLAVEQEARIERLQRWVATGRQHMNAMAHNSMGVWYRRNKRSAGLLEDGDGSGGEDKADADQQGGGGGGTRQVKKQRVRKGRRRGKDGGDAPGSQRFNLFEQEERDAAAGRGGSFGDNPEYLV